MDQQLYRKLVSRQVAPVIGTPVRVVLLLLSWLYGAIVRVRNGLYSRRWLSVHSVDVPVLCVGNLTTGGTGKTPLVVWLARLFDRKDLRVAVLTRGYKARQGTLSDEPAELASACPGAAVIVNADRVAGADEAVRNHGAQVLLMDDGFQHRRLARNLDIVAIDATLPFGYGRLLPAGLLREPLRGLQRAHAVVITRSDQVAEEQLDRIETRILQIQPELPIARAIHAPVGARCLDGSEIALEQLKGRNVFAFCGLGNPNAFLRTIEGCGCVLAGSQAFNDHHDYTSRCLADIYDKSWSCGADLVLTTTKDWSKIVPLIPAEPPLPTAFLAVELRFGGGDKPLTTLIEQAVAGTIRNL
ncbi:MAG: tetraacyldisaccharide 4'-kinase [Phycisphaerales bacterium]|nr:MAG: tetraacyldisaccharide 4'-kinase [Phycisphaerales bacterium]